jgi:hypothetical protein
MSGWLTFVLLRHGVERAGWHKTCRLQKSPAIHNALSVVRRDGGVIVILTESTHPSESMY